MKTTINGLTYNTETATLLASAGYPGSVTDFQNWDEALYRTAKGNHFLHGSGGPMSAYAEHSGNESRSGSRCSPMTQEEALAWCEKHDLQDAIDEHFSALVTDA